MKVVTDSEGKPHYIQSQNLVEYIYSICQAKGQDIVRVTIESLFMPNVYVENAEIDANDINRKLFKFNELSLL